MLSTAESLELQQLESIVERGLQSFYEAGQALKQIRDGKLYRQIHACFEDYCQARWQMKREYAWRLMSASQVVQLLPTGNKPQNEYQARPLTSLPPEQQAEAWQASQAIAGGQPTHQQVSRAVKAVQSGIPDLQPGQQVTVMDEKSPFYGKQVEVLDVDGVIVRARTETGDEPFLSSELNPQPQTKSVEQSWTAQKTKVDRMEALEATLQVAETRNQLLELMLGRLIAAAKAGAISDALLSDAADLLA